MSTTSVATREMAHDVAAELSELADVLERLDNDAWNAPSLCPGWRVREVVAHITMPVRWSAPAVLSQLARARFRWNTAADRIARRDAALPVENLVAALRSEQLHAWRPPGGGVQGALVHAVVHGLDVTVPLRIDRPAAAGRLRGVLDGLVRPASLKHFGLDVDGLALRAPEVDWAYGSGREVTADARTMALFLSGRHPRPGE